MGTCCTLRCEGRQRENGFHFLVVWVPFFEIKKKTNKKLEHICTGSETYEKDARRGKII